MNSKANQEVLEALNNIGETKGKYKLIENTLVHKENHIGIIVLILFLLITPTLINYFLVPKMTLGTAQEIEQIKLYVSVFCYGLPFLLLLLKAFTITKVEIDFSKKEIRNSGLLKSYAILFSEIEDVELEKFKRKGVASKTIFLKGNHKKVKIINTSGIFNEKDTQYAAQQIFNHIKDLS